MPKEEGVLCFASHCPNCYAQFTLVLRFILADAGRRTFRVERRCYLGSLDDWIHVGAEAPLAREWIPKDS